MGDGGLRLAPTLALDYSLAERWTIGANFSYVIRPTKQVLHVVSGDQLGWGAYLQGPAGTDSLSWHVAAYGARAP